MEVVWTEQATHLLVGFVSQYAQQYDSVTAYKVFDEVIKRTEVLADFPKIGRGGREPGTRELVLKGTPFITVYKITKHEVLVLRVLHGRQQWSPE